MSKENNKNLDGQKREEIQSEIDKVFDENTKSNADVQNSEDLENKENVENIEDAEETEDEDVEIEDNSDVDLETEENIEIEEDIDVDFNEQKKILNYKDRKSTLNNGYYKKVIILGFIAILCFTISLYSGISSQNNPVDIKNATLIEKLESPNISVVERDTEFRCISYTPVYDKDGTKQYEVKFKDTNSTLYITSIIPASEVDDFNRISEDARYKATVSYLYIENLFEDILKDLPEKDKKERLIVLLSGQSEYSNYGTICNIDFLFGSGVQEYNYDNANKYLVNFIERIKNPTENDNANENIVDKTEAMNESITNSENLTNIVNETKNNLIDENLIK